jgi:hypothetical protein
MRRALDRLTGSVAGQCIKWEGLTKKKKKEEERSW